MSAFMLEKEVSLQPIPRPNAGKEESRQEICVEITVEEPRVQENAEAITWPWLLGGGVFFLAAAAVLIVVLLRNICKKRKTAAEVILPNTEKEKNLRIGTLHEIGARAGQQDSFAVTSAELLPERGMLAVVADGMGGLENGDKVSQLVTSSMVDGFMAVEKPDRNTLIALVSEANLQVNGFLGEDGIGRSGSTVVAGLICGDEFHSISVGDSRICLYRAGQLVQLNREHTYLHELQLRVMNGVYDMDQTDVDLRADNLTSYIGMGYLRDADIPANPVKIVSGDKFILMSDGVYNALTEAELTDALKLEPEDAAKAIGQKIHEKAFCNQDNYTAVILGM